MDKSLQIIVVGVLVIFSIFFLREGITGMVMFDWKTPCNTNNDCENQVCCKFYQEDNGVCDSEDSCDFIYGVTKKEKEIMKLQEPELESPGFIPYEDTEKNRVLSYVAILIGLSLIIIVVRYFLKTQHTNKGKKKK